MQNLTRRETLGAILAASAVAFAREAQAADSVVHLSLLLVNDVYRMSENADRRGGLPRFAAVVASERAKAQAENRRLICVHAGDTLSPSLMSSLDQGAHMIQLFNDSGIDYFVPGNHEFDFGKEVYLERMGEAHFSILAANLRDSSGQKLPRHEDQVLIDVDGLKLALIGSAYDATPSVSRPGDLLFAPTLQTVTDAAATAKAAGADFVVAIVHADKPTGAALMDARRVDFILSGHNHDLHIDFDGRTGLMESQQDANYVSIVDIEIAVPKSPGPLSWWPNFRVVDTATVTPDAAILEKVDLYEAGLKKTFDVEIATLEAPLDSRAEIVRTQEAAIGDLFADALIRATEANAAIINGGAIRGNQVYPVGSRLTRRDILDELPFGNKTVVAKIPGKTILAALENGFSQLSRRSGRFPQVAGIKATVDAAAKSGARVKSVAINGEELDPERIYSLATDDFLALGGDGYGMLAGDATMTTDSGNRLVAQDVIDYLEAIKQFDAKVDGRIVFL
jgi:5'-nucleotidase/UDP-sugar diphosphatase